MPYVPSILLALVAGCSVPLTVTTVVRSAQIASVSTSVAVSPDGRLLASGGGDGTIKIWDLATGRMIRTLPGSGETILSVAISPDGRWLVSGGGAVSGCGLIKVWDIAAGRTVRTFDTHRGPVLVFLSSDGRWMVSSGDGVGVWEFAAGRKVANHVFVTDSVGAAVTPDGALVVFAAGHELAILDPANDRVVRTISGHTGDVYCVAISPDGRQVVSGGADGVIKVWDLATGGEMRTLSGHAGPVESVAISPDGRWVISGSRDHAIKIWDLGTGHLVRTLTGHASDVSSVAVSPDGRWVVSAAGDIKVWELATGRLVRTLYHAPSGQGMDTRLSAGLNER